MTGPSLEPTRTPTTEAPPEKIPFMDLPRHNESFEPELSRAIQDVIRQNDFIKGPRVEAFTCAFLAKHGGRFGVACANGTSAITVALRALKIGTGDEVLVPNHTFFGTLEPIVELGAKPVLIDLDEVYHQLDLDLAAKAITKRTRAIMPVHLYGLPEPMDQIMAFARAHNLDVIEDCAQAHLAKWNGRAVGTFGAAGTFSFYPGKNLGAFGDAGFVVTEDEAHFEFMSRYIDHGRRDKYVHEMFGGNFRMDALQGAVLEVKLKGLEAATARRRELAQVYDRWLDDAGFARPRPRPGATPVYHLYVTEVSNRTEVMDAFKRAQIGCGIHYPVTMSQQPALKGLVEGVFPVSERRCERILSLPFFPEMTSAQVERVAQIFLKVARP